MNKQTVIEGLALLGFRETGPTVYQCEIDHYCISVTIDSNDVQQSTIHYGNKIKVGHQGICNLQHDESLVQLECVIRLLRKGYPPQAIELERQYRLGRANKGRLDVLLKKRGKTWAMIECKTFGTEYHKEKALVASNGGQIFSYYAQNRNAKIIGIYASSIFGSEVVYQSDWIYTDSLNKTGEAIDIHRSWNKEFTQGLFDNSLDVYELTMTNLRKDDLENLTKETGKGLFNGFANILRKYAISDKSNAFNVIFNLFVCKIYDEDTKSETEETDFQWKVGDTKELLLARLSQLYYQSIKRYLNIDIEEDFFPKTSHGHSMAIKEFSFVEVNNSATFELNGSVLLDVVQTLQHYRIKYSAKHQFLGEFFEQLLHAGVKQETGQFFTPIPLARFILRALPLDKVIQTKIHSKDPHILPYVIDNACGSGHFLTEAMAEIESHFTVIHPDHLTGQQSRYFDSSKNNYLWARDYIYGIEKDSRLAKTTKIAMFLNGDGDATIIGGDGLDDFGSSASYTGKLKAAHPCTSLNAFDVLVSNPPFSVDGFANTLVHGTDNFSLYPYVGDKSSEIECFFIERMIQLLTYGGVAGLILPLSILNNNRSVYVHARRLLLLNCQLISLVELREKAMMATGTSVVILFLRKRTRHEMETMLDIFEQRLLSDERENGNADPQLQLWHQELREIGYFREDPHNQLLRSILVGFEKERQVLIGFSGEKKQQEYFLGYRFSKARGREGLKELETGLLVGTNGKTPTPNSLAARIHDAYLDQCPNYGPSVLDPFVGKVSLADIVNLDSLVITNPSSLLSSKTVHIESLSPYGDFIDDYEGENYTLDRLIQAQRASIISGVIYDKAKDELPTKTNVRVITASNMDIKTGLLDLTAKMIYLRNTFECKDVMRIRKFDIIMSMSSGSLKHLAKVTLATENRDEIVGGFLNIIRTDDSDLALALYFRFLSKAFRTFAFSKKGQNINNIVMSAVKQVPLRLPKDLGRFAEEARRRLGIPR